MENIIKNCKKIATIEEHRSTLETAILMTEEFIGAVVVTSSFVITGIFTERDLMMKVVGRRKDPENAKVGDVMLTAPIKVSPEDTTSHCLDLMKEHRCRHLLVFAQDEFVGIVPCFFGGDPSLFSDAFEFPGHKTKRRRGDKKHTDDAEPGPKPFRFHLCLF